MCEGVYLSWLTDIHCPPSVLADASLGEGKRKNSTRLTIEDLKNLFGIE